MSKNSRDKRPYVKPVTRLELDHTNLTLRWIIFGVAFIIAIVAFGYGLNEALRTEPGWKSVKSASGNPNSGQEFILMYDYSEYGGSATQTEKLLSTLYSEISEEAFEIFSPDIREDGLLNVSHINASVNEEISVHPALYRALELLETYQNRCIFLAPVYAEYNQVFNSEADPIAATFDPARNPEVMAYIRDVVAFTSDPSMISIDLMGENRIRLNVSEAYLNFAQEHGIEEFVDFGWMRNAFVADFLAEQLIANGYTEGYLVSFDGFTRNLDDADQLFNMNLFDLQGTDIYLPAIMSYSGQTSLVYLRSYPLDDLDQWNTYAYEDGTIVTAHIDPVDGINKSALNNMVSYSKNFGCAELLMHMIPVYVTDAFSAESVNDMTSQDIYSVWFEDGTLFYNDANLMLKMESDASGKIYQKVLYN